MELNNILVKMSLDEAHVLGYVYLI